MKIRNQRRTAVLLLIMACALLITACSGGSAKARKYTWNDAEFTVKEITDAESVVGEEAKKMDGKCVAVVIDFGDDTISQSAFEKKVANGQFVLSGKKPSTYEYHMSSMTFTANGFEAQITGETTLFFNMDSDYEIKEDDLEIKE